MQTVTIAIRTKLQSVDFRLAEVSKKRGGSSNKSQGSQYNYIFNNNIYGLYSYRIGTVEGGLGSIYRLGNQLESEDPSTSGSANRRARNRAQGRAQETLVVFARARA